MVAKIKIKNISVDNKDKIGKMGKKKKKKLPRN